jgi:hypothetical protein
MTSQPVGQHYAIETLIPAQNSISGDDYWAAIRLENGKFQTDNLEFAKSNLRVAQQNFSSTKVRLVLVQTIVVESNDEDTLEEFTQALSELLSSLCKNADMALNGEWDRSDEGFIDQIDQINEFCHKFNIPIYDEGEEVQPIVPLPPNQDRYGYEGRVTSFP